MIINFYVGCQISLIVYRKITARESCDGKVLSRVFIFTMRENGSKFVGNITMYLHTIVGHNHNPTNGLKQYSLYIDQIHWRKTVVAFNSWPTNDKFKISWRVRIESFSLSIWFTEVYENVYRRVREGGRVWYIYSMCITGPNTNWRNCKIFYFSGERKENFPLFQTPLAVSKQIRLWNFTSARSRNSHINLSIIQS